MQDDESIVKMFLALKKNPKISLKQRLIKADINGDKKLFILLLVTIKKIKLE